MLGKPRILSLFPDSFDKFSKSYALMLDPLIFFLNGSSYVLKVERWCG